MLKDVSTFVSVVRRITFFKGLNPDQVATLLRACDRRQLEPHDNLCTAGDPSNEMCILLSGRLSVQASDGSQVAVITPVAPVGEMGLFTGEPRSATVVATDPSSLFVLGKPQLDLLMRRDRQLQTSVSQSIIAVLAQRIRESNQELAHLRAIIADQDAAPLEDDDEDDG